MATDVDLKTVGVTVTSVLNGSSTNQTLDFLNMSVTTSDKLSENTTGMIITTEPLVYQSVSEEKQWGWLATIVLLLATLLVNGAVLGVTWRATRLHSSLFALLASLAFAHTLNAFLVMPMAINAAIHDESEVPWSVCVARMCLTQFLASVVLVHLALCILHCLVLLLSPLWYRQCTGIIYPCLLTTAAWILPLLLIVPGAAVLNAMEPTNCAYSLSVETLMALHVPTYYGPAVVVAVIYSIVTYIIQNRNRVTSQLHHEGIENAAAGNEMQRNRWSSIISNHSSMITYNSETPSICSDNASVHSIPSIDIDDGSAVAISLPNGRNGFVHLNQAPPNGLFVPNAENGGVSGNGNLANGHVPNGNGEAPRRHITNGSAVCLPDTISPATTEDDKKKMRPSRDMLKQMSSDSDSMQLEIHKIDIKDDSDEMATGQDDLQSEGNDASSENSDARGNVLDASDSDREQDDTLGEPIACTETGNAKEPVNRKLSAISERDDSSSMSVKSDESSSQKGTPTHTTKSAPEVVDAGLDAVSDETSSLATGSTVSADQQSTRSADDELGNNFTDDKAGASNDRDSNNKDTADESLTSVNEMTSKTDNATDEESPTTKSKTGKEQLNVPLDDTDVEICIETDKLVTDSDQDPENGLDNFGFVLNDGEELSLSDAIKVKHKQTENGKEKSDSTDELLAKNDQQKDNSSEGTQSANHSRNSSQGGGINGPRRSILRRDRSKRLSTKSVKFDIPDTHDDNKPKRLHRKPTGKVPRNQQLRSKKGSKGSAKGNESTSKRRRTLVKQKPTEEPPTPTEAPVSNGIISPVAPYATRPPLVSSSSSFGYMAAVQSSQAERLNHRIKAQQVNVNTLFCGFLTYVILTGPHIVLTIARSLCSTCDISSEIRLSLQWVMYSASLILPVVLLCFLPEYKSAIRDPDAK